MSGGTFNNNGYIYYQVHQFADELENRIENNAVKDEYGYYSNYPEEILQILRAQVPEINRIAKIMRAIDYLYSGDHGEDSFLRAINKAINNDEV
jgi:hypothetical protein